MYECNIELMQHDHLWKDMTIIVFWVILRQWKTWPSCVRVTSRNRLLFNGCIYLKPLKVCKRLLSSLEISYSNFPKSHPHKWNAGFAWSKICCHVSTTWLISNQQSHTLFFSRMNIYIYIILKTWLNELINVMRHDWTANPSKNAGSAMYEASISR